MGSNNPKKRKAGTNPDGAGPKSAFAHYNSLLVENPQKKPRVDDDSDDNSQKKPRVSDDSDNNSQKKPRADKDSDDTFEGFSDSDSSWKGCEN